MAIIKQISYKALRKVDEGAAIPRWHGVYRIDPEILCFYVAPIPLNFVFSFLLRVMRELRFPFFCNDIYNARIKGYTDGFYSALEADVISKANASKVAQLHEEGFKVGYDYAFEFLRNIKHKEDNA